MTTVTAFILIITTWNNNGPLYSMQEFSSETSCMAAKHFVEQRMEPPGVPMVLVQCVAK